MKKLSFAILSAVVALTACSKQEDPVNGGFVEATIVASVPAPDIRFRSSNDADYPGYVMRYIVELYDNTTLYKRFTQFDSDNSDAGNVFNIRIPAADAAKSYTVVVWADYVPEGNTSSDTQDGYYDTQAGLTAIVLADPTEISADTTTRDAFYGVGTEELDIMNATTPVTSVAVTCKRPFAQINITTTDIAYLAASEQPKSVSIAYSIPTGFNALTGIPTAPVAVAFAADADAPVGTAPNISVHLSSNFVFASSTQVALADFTMTFYDDTAENQATADPLTTYEFTNIPFQQNYRTNVSGNLMTMGGAVTVTANPGYETPDIDETL